MAYSKRYAGGFKDKPDLSTPIDSTFLNAVESALVSLFGVAPVTNGALVWDGTQFTAANKITNSQIDAAAAIAKSKLDLAGQLTDADIAGAAAISRSKLNFGAGLVNADISAVAAISSSKVSISAPSRVGNPMGMGAIGVAAANAAILLPVWSFVAFSISAVYFRVTTQAGNLDVGLYDSTLAKIATSGSFACPAAGQVSQALSATVPAGLSYLALASDNAAFRMGGLDNSFSPGSYALQKTTSFVLPASLSGATASANTPAIYVA